MRPRLGTSYRAGVGALVPRTCRAQAWWGCGPGRGRDPLGFFQVTGEEHTGEDGRGEARRRLRGAGGGSRVRLGLLLAPCGPGMRPLPALGPQREGQDAHHSVAPSPDCLCLWARAPELSVPPAWWQPQPLCVSSLMLSLARPRGRTPSSPRLPRGPRSLAARGFLLLGHLCQLWASSSALEGPGPAHEMVGSQQAGLRSLTSGKSEACLSRGKELPRRPPAVLARPE